MEDLNEMLSNNDFLILYKFDGEKRFEFCKTEKDVRIIISNLKSNFRNGFKWYVLETRNYILRDIAAEL